MCAPRRPLKPPPGPHPATRTHAPRPAHAGAGGIPQAVRPAVHQAGRETAAALVVPVREDRPASRDSLVGKLKRAAEKLNTRKLTAEIERLAPDVILCTHFLPAELLSRQKSRRARSCRRCGCRSRTSTCTRSGCTNTSIATAWPARKWRSGSRIAACRAEKIVVTGIPVMPQFTAPLDARRMRTGAGRGARQVHGAHDGRWRRRGRAR